MIADSSRTAAAWNHMVETGHHPPQLLRSHIDAAWRRCREYRVDPRAMAPRWLSQAETSALLEAKRELIEAARPYMRALSLAAGAERHAAMLGDENAIVLDIVADEETAHRTPGFPTPGSLLSEQVAGANGIGTALAENKYVDLVGPEHFIQGFHVYTCQGLPLRGPDRSTVGVLSTSVRRIEASERLREILICAAHGIEAELSRRQLEREIATALRRNRDDAASLEALRQDVTQLQTAGRLRLERACQLTKAAAAPALDLIAEADRLIERFRRQAGLWRDIAFKEVGLPQPVDVQGLLLEIAEMLLTEGAVRETRLAVAPHPPAVLLADTRELARRLFRFLLHALEGANPGSQLQARLETPEPGHVRVLCIGGPAEQSLALTTESATDTHEHDPIDGTGCG